MGLGSLPLFAALRGGFVNPFSQPQVINGAAIWRLGLCLKAFHKQLGKGGAGVVVSMVDKNLRRLLRKAGTPIQQALLVGVATDAG